MTTTATETLVHQDADLLQRLHSVLGEHPAGPSFQLLFAPEGLDIASDEVLVQKLNHGRNVIELRPCKVADLTLTDVPHSSQIVPLSDDDFAQYTQRPEATTVRQSRQRARDGSRGELTCCHGRDPAPQTGRSGNRPAQHGSSAPLADHGNTVRPPTGRVRRIVDGRTAAALRRGSTRARHADRRRRLPARSRRRRPRPRIHRPSSHSRHGEPPYPLRRLARAHHPAPEQNPPTPGLLLGVQIPSPRPYGGPTLRRMGRPDRPGARARPGASSPRTLRAGSSSPPDPVTSCSCPAVSVTT
ncbi:hypothetical protein ACRAWF_26645 [Streptomyces sp. L7]